MRPFQPVIWSKGASLAPQHLQTQDNYIESSIHFRLQALNFRPWGFRELALDQEKLAAGMFGITRASGVFQDGLLFDMPDCDPLPPAKSLTDAFEEDEDTVDVYMTIPEVSEKSANVAISKIDTDTRYSAHTVLLRDENSGQMERPVQLARKNFRFLLQRQVREGISLLRVARVRRKKATTYEFDSAFVPPVLDYTANGYLVSVLRRLVEILSTKSSNLAATVSQKNQTLASFSTSDIPNFWSLYTINSYFPLLNHLFGTGSGHPERLFAAMLSLAGTLTTFSNEVRPADLPLYDHDNLYPCFSDLEKKLTQLLEIGVPAKFVSIPLKLIQPSIYGASISDDKYLTKTKMYLAITADMNQGNLVSNTLQLVKVGSPSFVERAVKTGVDGMPLSSIQSPPRGVQVKLSHQYFALDQIGNAWDGIRRERYFAAYVPGEFPNPQLELIVVFL